MRLNIPDVDIHLSPEEWDAVFSGALDKTIFDYLMQNCDTRELFEKAFSKSDIVISDDRKFMVKRMNELGYSRSQIAEHTNLTPRQISDILE